MVESVAERLKGVFRFIYFLPTVSAAVAVAMMWAYVFHPQQGLLNSVIRAVGLTPPRSWLTDPQAFVLGVPLAMIAVIIAYVWQDFGYNLVIFIAALQGIPREITRRRAHRRRQCLGGVLDVTLPLLRPTLLLVLHADDDFVLPDICHLLRHDWRRAPEPDAFADAQYL